MSAHDCDVLRDAVVEWPDGTLRPEVARRVARHLQVCGRCRGLAGELARLRDAARALEPPEPPARIRAAVLSAVAVQAAAERGRSSAADATRPEPSDPGGGAARPPRAWAGVRGGRAVGAVGVAALVLVVVLVRPLSHPEPGPPGAALPDVGASAPAGGGADLVAPTAGRVDADLRQAERFYRELVAAGSPVVNRPELEALEVTVRHHLRMLDRAIEESRRAAGGPGEADRDGLAVDALMHGLSRKRALLEHAMDVVHDLRKGA